MRGADIKRDTNETKITCKLNIDGQGISDIKTGVGFLDHMLTLFSKHGKFDLNISCKGDTYVDFHHTIEDVGIVLGMAFNKALKDKKGISRYGFMILPMDEALILSSIDFSGRSYLSYDLCIPTQKVGDFDTELVEEFFNGFVRNALCTLHLRQLSGSNSHHIIEGAFKSFARSVRAAAAVEKGFENDMPSTKGIL